MDISVWDTLGDRQIEKLYRLFQNEWWTKDRTIEDIRVMLKHTDFVFGFCVPDNGELIGFARVVSDWVYKAFIFDVIVDLDYRNKGLGKFIMNTIFNHAVIKNVLHVELYCPEKLWPFYEKMGFERRTSLLLRHRSV